MMLGAQYAAQRFYAAGAGSGTPVVGLAYNPKFKGFFQLIGCSKLIPIEEFVEKNMAVELFGLLESSLHVPKDCIPTAVSGLIERFRGFNVAIATM
ncbi:MAG: hypothetical protein U5R30_07220 [Deltaproteobacteria bacterium]|nr:hypothetical protein [Deltaproteobacteria bacterium]